MPCKPPKKLQAIPPAPTIALVSDFDTAGLEEAKRAIRSLRQPELHFPENPLAEILLSQTRQAEEYRRAVPPLVLPPSTVPDPTAAFPPKVT